MEDPNEDEDLIPPDVRRPQRLLDSRRQADGELSDSDDEGEDDRRNHASHRDKDSITTPSARRFGAAVGIMSTGSTHGIGPTVALPVTSSGPAVSSAGSEMDLDDDETPLAQTSQVKAKGKEPAPAETTSSASASDSNAMAVDPPAAPSAPS